LRRPAQSSMAEVFYILSKFATGLGVFHDRARLNRRSSPLPLTLRPQCPTIELLVGEDWLEEVEAEEERCIPTVRSAPLSPVLYTPRT
jgi:hypothetical protein